MMEMDLAHEEKRAIAALKRVAKKWPGSLWLYSASGTLNVMKKKEDGERAITSIGGVNSDYIVTSIDISNDGGDW